MSTPTLRVGRAGDAKLLYFLQRQEILNADDAPRIARLAEEARVSLHEVLESEGILAQKDLALLLATSLGLRLIDLGSFALDTEIAREVQEDLALRYEILPIRSDAKTMDVATANPLDLESLKSVEFATGKRIQPLVTTQVDLRDALGHAYHLQESLDAFLRHVPVDPARAVDEIPDDEGDLRSLAPDAELPPVIKLANLVLLEGIKGRASDVQIEPGTDTVAVRYGLDGVVVESFRFPKWVQTSLVARLKVMAALDITERRIRQDGRIRLRHEDALVDLRVSSLPAHDGEKIVIRRLDAHGIQVLERIGLSMSDLGRMREALRRPQGMILVAGPAESGKTTTLYTLLKERFTPDLNIVSIESPIEYRLQGIHQVQVNERQGLGFAAALRTALRHEPDVIVVGEIRDTETAHLAFQAAQSGHLVVSTLQSPDAAAAISRLIDLGVEPYAIASGLQLVVAQRLLRRTCGACGLAHEPNGETRYLLGLPKDSPPMRRGAGCPSCRQTGFAGRVGAFELLPVSPAIATMIEAGASEGAIRDRARTEGARSLLEDAIDKLRAGVTSADEVLRVVRIDGRAAGSPDDERSYTALIVDDAPTILAVVRETLETSDLGLDVVAAESGAQALERAARVRPDVVILDIDMPGMDGFEVCRALRSNVRTAFVPVLMLTADGSENSMARSFGVGADDFMTKPVRREVLVARVRRMLERTYGTRPAARPSTPASSDGVTSDTVQSLVDEVRRTVAEVHRTVAEVRDEVARALAAGRAEAAETRRLAEQALGLVRGR